MNVSFRGIANNLTGLFKPKPRRLPLTQQLRGVGFDDIEAFFKYFGIIDDSNITITENTALTLSAVYACVMAKANDIAITPWNVMKRDGNKRLVATDHHQHFLLKTEPHPDYTSFEFRRDMVVFRELWGNAYAIIHRNERNGRPESYEIRHPMFITPFRDDDGNVFYKDYERDLSYAKVDMIHLRSFSVDGLEGKGVIRLMGEQLRGRLSMDRFKTKFWQNGTYLSGWVESPPIIKDKAERDRILQAWEDRYSGPNNGGKTAMLMGGAKYHQLTQPLRESQFVETEKFSVEEIARILNVPLHRIGHLDKMSFNNVAQLSIEYVKYSLTPIAIGFEQEFDRKVFKAEAGVYNKMDLKGLMRGDIKERTEFYQVMLGHSVFSVNQVLELEDMNPLDKDIRLIPMNMIPVEFAEDFYSKLTKDGEARDIDWLVKQALKQNGDA